MADILENGGNTQANQNENGGNETLDNQENNTGIDFEKLDSILDKKIEKLQKNVLKDNGMADEDIKSFLEEYKASKQKQEQNKADKLQALINENKTLKDDILKKELNSSAEKVAKEVGINPKYIKQTLKLADLKDAIKDGKVDNEALKTSFENVLKDCEAFKMQDDNNNTGFKNIGGNSSNNKDIDDGTAKMMRAFGIKEMKNKK